MSERNPFIKPEVVSWEQAAILRQKTPTEKFEILRGIWRKAQMLAEEDVRRQHPDWTDDRVAQEVAPQDCPKR